MRLKAQRSEGEDASNSQQESTSKQDKGKREKVSEWRERLSHGRLWIFQGL